jgi:subtilase family serine protease
LEVDPEGGARQGFVLMRSRLVSSWLVALAVPWAWLLACSSVGDGSGPAQASLAIQVSPADDARDDAALAAIPHHAFADDGCAVARPGAARCFAKRRIDADGDLQSFASPSGLAPADLKKAYEIPASSGAAPVIALIDASDDPNAEADLAVYRSTFKLPPCTTANGCFRKVSQRGATTDLPTPDPEWAGEISLDVDVASAACPACKLLLVEADSQDVKDLGAAVVEAVKLGAAVVSNSYGWSEAAVDASDDSLYFHHPGVAIFASSGDSGFGVSYPSSGQYVIGVGGTTITKSTSTRGWAEAAWSDGGSGCSALTTKPAWQTDKGCATKMVADVSAVGDPDTGVAVYNTFGMRGWVVYGGTSVSSPLVAGIFAAAGKGAADASSIWTNTASFRDITKGFNGACSTDYFCKAGKGYDGPTGWGTPFGNKLAAL